MIIESSRAAPVDRPVLHMIGIEKNTVRSSVHFHPKVTDSAQGGRGAAACV